MRINVKRVAWLAFIIVLALLARAIYEIVFDLYATRFSFSQIFQISLRFIVPGIAVLIWIGIVTRSEYSASKLPWLIILALEPFIGLALFFTFGRNFRRSERYLNHPLIVDGLYLSHEPTTDFDDPKYLEIDSEITDIYKTAYNMTKHHAYLDDSSVTVLTNGAMKFPTLVEALNQATSFIFMQYYIIRTDKIGKQILHILEQKAKQGVEVKILYDGVGSVFLNKKFMKELTRSGIEIAIHDRVYFALFDTRLNFRNHRKITVIDGKYGFTGGMNLADEYDNKIKKFGFFRDTHLLIEGQAVNSLTALFLRDWYYSTSKFIDKDKYYQAKPVHNKGLVQIIPSGPDFKYPPIRNSYVKMINNAKESIKIMTPYLALDHETLTSLIIASDAGVDVNIIVPGIPDKKSIYIVTKSFFEELLEAGIKIHVYKHGFTHAKIFIMDDKLASCGTYNLDNRSARINFENTVLISGDAVKDLVDDFDKDLSYSTHLNLSKWKKRGIYTRLIQGLFNLFSPIV